MIYNNILKKVEEKFKDHPDRLTHTLGVVEMSLKLAKIYNVDETEAKIAALLHDYTKYDSNLFHKENMSNDDFLKYEKEPYIYHAISASNILKSEFNINNNNIKEAIRYHVYGKVNMTILNKILLISDKTEKNRNYPLVNKLREIVVKDINLAIILFLEDNIMYNKSRGFNVNDELIQTLEYLKKEQNE